MIAFSEIGRDESERVYNFGAGPAMLPDAVMQRAQQEWKETPLGFSIFETSHRSESFEECFRKTEALLRRLVRIPNDYNVLFMQGGATAQFSAIPLNLSVVDKRALYCISGTWSSLAATEASRYCSVERVECTSQRDGKTCVRSVASSCQALSDKGTDLSQRFSYLYYCDNETIEGLEHKTLDHVSILGQLPIVSDMSSNILSRSFDVSRYGCVFASAQKNLGPSGLTINIVRSDLLANNHGMEGVQRFTPKVLDYKTYSSTRGAAMPNTPCTFAIYMTGLVLEWIESSFGGLEGIEQNNARKSELLYRAIDEMQDKYANKIDESSRSRMNVVFRVLDPDTAQPSAAIESRFLREAAHQGLCNLEGHRSVGGIRASLYNAMPLGGVERLVSFMREFECSLK